MPQTPVKFRTIPNSARLPATGSVPIGAADLFRGSAFSRRHASTRYVNKNNRKAGTLARSILIVSHAAPSAMCCDDRTD